MILRFASYVVMLSVYMDDSCRTLFKFIVFVVFDLQNNDVRISHRFKVNIAQTGFVVPLCSGQNF